jgi:hypothetical protein
MNLIAENGHRKWPYGAPPRATVALVTRAAALLWLGMQGWPVAARPIASGDWFDRPHRLHRTAPMAQIPPANIPLPKPRPAEAPAADSESSPVANGESRSDKRAEPAAASAPQPSACREALTEEIAIAPSIPDIHDAGGCGGTDLVRLEAIVLPDKQRVAVTPPATLRCSMASEIADWVRTDIAPIMSKLGSEVRGLDNYDSYECRGFNGVRGAHLSEHGHANALDVHAFKLADGRSIALTDRTVPREVRESVLHSVCARFTTVLGPDSDWYHEDHIHLDLMERRNNYKICQWDVLDPLPQVAPLLPAERPEEAPPREVAAKSDSRDKGEVAEPEAAKQDARKPEAEEEPAPVPPRKTAATKKRR